MPDQQFQLFFEQYHEEELRSRPVHASRMGDHRFDDQIEDLSAEARTDRLASRKRTLARLEAEIPYDQLSRASQIDYEVFRHDLREGIWLEENLRPFEEDPRIYNEYLTGSVYCLLTQSSLPPEINISNAVARMRRLPAVVAVAQTTLTSPPLPVLETSIVQNRGVIDFYEKGIYDLVGDTPQLTAVREAAGELLPHLSRHQEFLENDLRARATKDWRLGSEKFDRKLQFAVNAGITAREVLERAESEFERVTSEMAVVSRQLWGTCFPGRALPPEDDAGRHQCIT